MGPSSREQAAIQSESLKLTIRNLLVRKGFLLVYAKDAEALPCSYGTVLFPNCVGVFSRARPAFPSIHGTNFKSMFMLHRPSWATPVGLECHGQTKNGSADQKLEYLYANIMEQSAYPFLVILDGPAFRAGVITRGREMEKRSAGKITLMTSFRDLERWEAEGDCFPYPKWSLPSRSLFGVRN